MLVLMIASAVTTLQPEFEKQARRRDEEQTLSSALVKDQSKDVVLSNTSAVTDQIPISSPESPTKNDNAKSSRQFSFFNFNSKKFDPAEGQTGGKDKFTK